MGDDAKGFKQDQIIRTRDCQDMHSYWMGDLSDPFSGVRGVVCAQVGHTTDLGVRVKEHFCDIYAHCG